jgi:uncharacterized damage-inducible protein DinB
MKEPSTSTVSPEQACSLRDFFLPAIESSHRINRLLIQSVPADKLEFKPDPGSFALSDILWSLVATEHFFLTGICDARFPPPPSKPEAIGIPELLAWDDAHFPHDFQRLALLSGEELLHPVEFLGTTTTALELLHSQMGNLSQHRGQIAIYLQLAGVSRGEVPAEGAAADELSEADLKAVAGGVTVTFTQHTKTAQQLGWLPAPQTQATLGQLFSSSGTPMAGLAGLPAGIAAAIAIPMYISTFFML